MATQAIEKVTSRKLKLDSDGDLSTGVFLWTVLATGVDEEDEDAVLTALLSAAATSYTRAGVTLTRRTVFVEHAGGGVWNGRVNMSRVKDAPLLGGGGGASSSYQFETAGGTETKLVSDGTTSYPVGAPDLGNAIMYDGEDVQGVDVPVAAFAWAEVHIQDSADVDAAYKNTLLVLTNTLNDDTFRGLGARQMMFLGASGALRGGSDWEITYRFSAGPHLTGQTVGGITGVAKEAHQFLWALFAKEVDSNVLVKKPSAIYVEDMYKEGDFDGLEI